MPSPRRLGFTLIELMVVIAIIAVLVSIAFPTWSAIQNLSSSTQSVAHLKQIGAAIQSYANDNDSFLPGPILGGQFGTYVGGTTVSYSAQLPQNAGGMLLPFIGPYLGNPANGKTAYTGVFMYPAFVPYAQKNPTAPIYCRSDISSTGLADATTIPSGQDPWGYPTPPATKPHRLSEVALFCLSLANTWALSEMDAQLPGIVSSDGWYAEIPKQPLHHAGRNALYFDWHVARMDAKGNSD